MPYYKGYFDYPNIWYAYTDKAKTGDHYKFYVIGGVPGNEKHRHEKYCIDPYTRWVAETENGWNNCVIINTTAYNWKDKKWKTPDMKDLILYELSVFGFTEGDNGIAQNNQGKYKGIIDRIKSGYFVNNLDFLKYLSTSLL